VQVDRVSSASIAYTAAPVIQDTQLKFDVERQSRDIESFYKNVFNKLQLSVGAHNRTLAEFTWAAAMTTSRAITFEMPDGSEGYVVRIVAIDPTAFTHAKTPPVMRLATALCHKPSAR
jgi:hypothetical protein